MHFDYALKLQTSLTFREYMADKNKYRDVRIFFSKFYTGCILCHVTMITELLMTVDLHKILHYVYQKVVLCQEDGNFLK